MVGQGMTTCLGSPLPNYTDIPKRPPQELYGCGAMLQFSSLFSSSLMLTHLVTRQKSASGVAIIRMRFLVLESNSTQDIGTGVKGYSDPCALR